MLGNNEIIKLLDNGKLSFGGFEFTEKRKNSDFEAEGNVYSIKTHNEITRLEKNGRMLVETVPGSIVNDFCMYDDKVEFNVFGDAMLQVTLELEANCEYEIYIDGNKTENVKSGVAGKVSFNVNATKNAAVKVKKM